MLNKSRERKFRGTSPLDWILLPLPIPTGNSHGGWKRTNIRTTVPPTYLVLNPETNSEGYYERSKMGKMDVYPNPSRRHLKADTCCLSAVS